MKSSVWLRSSLPKVLLWPVSLLVIHVYILLYTKFAYTTGLDSSGLGAVGFVIFDMLIISSLIVYIPVSIICMMIQKYRGTPVQVLYYLLIGFTALFGFLLPGMLHLADIVLHAGWWSFGV